jgi:phenylpropionate dioxygenase-like ring-hydroxylating dioxygenase large terminal subunit
VHKDEQNRLRVELDAYIRTRSTAMADAEWLNPSSVYGDPHHLELERGLLFDGLPLVVAHGTELPASGDFVTRDVLGVPLLLVRQVNGSVKAFLNVCRHRASRLVGEPSGCERRFTCPFHAWTYGTDGQLAGIPNEDGFLNLDREHYGLVELPIAQRHGLIWAGLVPEATLDVAGLLADLDDELTAFDLGMYVMERSATLSGEMNWKLVVDGFLETYHIRFLHPRTLSPHVRSNLGAFRAFGPNGRMAVVRNSYEPGDVAVEEDFLRQVSLVYQLFPNTVLVWLNDHFELWNVLPDRSDPKRCQIRVSLLVRPEDLGKREAWDKNWKILENTVFSEDWKAACSAQLSLSSPVAPSHVVYGRNEPALQHYHRQLAARLELSALPS